MNDIIHTYKLQFTAPLHISNERTEDYGSGSSTIHNDTLYAAILQCWAMLGKTDWIPSSNDKAAFVTSSMFPFAKDELFFPRPIIKTKADHDNAKLDSKIVKKIKKAKFIDTAILIDQLTGKKGAYTHEDNFESQFWSSKPMIIAPITSQVMPRSRVREGEDTDIFYIERFYFANDCGLYFFASFDEDEAQKRFEIGLNLLADEGIGTDRNIGHGKFTYTKLLNTTVPNIASRNQKLSMILGMYCPEDESDFLKKINQPNVGFDIEKRGGWLSEPYQSWRKKSVYMLRPGGVLPANTTHATEVSGKVVDLKPDSISHPVWRSGKTLFLNF